MDPFEPPGDPGDPGDRRTKPETQEKTNFVNTATRRQKEIRPELAEHQSNANCNNTSSTYNKGTQESPRKDVDKDTEDPNTSIIERLLQRYEE